MPTCDSGLKQVLKQYANELRGRFEVGESVVFRVMREIYDRMSPMPPTIPSVAKALGLSERSLQRQLKLEGETYKRLVERARMELSERYLLHSSHNVDEVAYLSGYADSSSFVRAFRRWHGESPRQFTNRRKSDESS